MFDGVGEVLEGADGDGPFRGVLGGGVGLGDVGDDHLHIALSAQRARLQQGLAVVHAAPIHVQAWRQTTRLTERTEQLQNSTRPITGSKRASIPPCLGTLTLLSEWVLFTIQVL
jgi:hypothetical protein